MTDMEAPNELLTFFKALADETRLKIVGVLARQPCSGEQLAAIVELKPATITHHLQKLMSGRTPAGRKSDGARAGFNGRAAAAAPVR
jgi:predicted transcriptional regulator